MGFKELCPGAQQNSVLNARNPAFFSHKNMTFQTIRTNILTFPTVGENIYSSRTAINWSLNMEE